MGGARPLDYVLLEFSCTCLFLSICFSGNDELVTHGLGSAVSRATAYGLDGLGIESRWRRDFPHLSRPALRPTQPPVQWVPGLSPGVRCCWGVTLTPHPLLVQRSKIKYSYTSTLPNGLRGLSQGEIYLHFILYLSVNINWLEEFK